MLGFLCDLKVSFINADEEATHPPPPTSRVSKSDPTANLSQLTTHS